MLDFLSGPGEAKVASEEMKLAKEAREDILGFLRESLGYQKDLMQWQKDVYERERTERKPYTEASQRSLGDLEAMMKGDFDITTTKSYQTKEKALETSLNRSLAAKGLSLSGRGIEEESRLKTGLMLGEESQRYEQLAGLVNVGTMGMVQTPMLASSQNIQQGYESMAQVPAWYASQMGGIYRNVHGQASQAASNAGNTVMSLLGGYMGTML